MSHSELVVIGLEICADFTVRGKIGKVCRHRKVLELRKTLRGDDAGGFMHAGPVLPKNPVAADRVRLVKACGIRQAKREKVLKSCKTRRPGADDTNARVVLWR